MWSRKRLDLSWNELLFAAVNSATAFDRTSLAAKIAERWSPAGEVLVCLSVRSAFDLLLTCLDLPAGSEVLVSAVTIPGMLRIIEEHGLIAVPVDLDSAQMSPRLDALARGRSPRTRAVLVAHLFGARLDLQSVADFARQYGLILIEDAAQAYAGPVYTGHHAADVSLFSFGPIKTSTALGGAIARVRDPQLLSRMRQLKTAWPVQSWPAFAARVLKYAGLKAASSRLAYSAIVSACRTIGFDHDRLVNGSVRGFAEAGFFKRIRQQPSAPLLAILNHRLASFDEYRLAERVRRAEFIMADWCGSQFFPSSACEHHAHWLLPVYVDDPTRIIATLAAAGFDATQGQSLTVVPPPHDRPELDPIVARRVMAGIVFLPCYPEMPLSAVEHLSRIVLRECERRAGKQANRRCGAAMMPPACPEETHDCYLDQRAPLRLSKSLSAGPLPAEGG